MGLEGRHHEPSAASTSATSPTTTMAPLYDKTATTILVPETTTTTRRRPEVDTTSTDDTADDTSDDDDRVPRVPIRRRTSIPSSFAYGDDATAAATAAAAVASAAAGLEERRWRSFDCNGSTSAAKALGLGVLASRIEWEESEAAKRAARLRPRRRAALFETVAGFFSAERREQVRRRQMQMIADVAKRSRSLVILNDMRTLVMTMDDPEDEVGGANDEQTPRGSSFAAATAADASIQRLLDGLSDADAVLADDSLHRVLELQSQWLQRSLELHAAKVPTTASASAAASASTTAASSSRHGSASMALQHFLAEFIRVDGTQRVPCALDLPTPALVRFEKLVSRHRLLRRPIRRSFDRLCRETMAAFTTTTPTDKQPAVWTTLGPRDALQSLVRELMDAIIEVAWIADKYRCILRAFVEQMVFSRLAGVCYRTEGMELDEKNTIWREQIVKARALALHEVGLPTEIPTTEADNLLFAKSVDAFNRLPHLVPSCVLAAFLSAIRVLYDEAKELLGLSCQCISADVLLPLLVFVLSRSDLPHLHSQVFVMENYAIETSQEGSEAAYYLACLQAAMGYIMTEIGQPKPEGA